MMEGVWGKVLLPVQLTSSGRAVLGPSEVECQLLPAVDLQLEGLAEAKTLKSGDSHFASVCSRSPNVALPSVDS